MAEEGAHGDVYLDRGHLAQATRLKRPLPAGEGGGVKGCALRRHSRARDPKSRGTKPLTLTLSQREGRPLSWAPSADAVAGGGDKGRGSKGMICTRLLPVSSV